jgi:uncharacterized membrane protein
MPRARCEAAAGGRGWRIQFRGVTGFLLLKWLHVLSAIVAVGANATYGLWSARAGSEPAHLGFALRGIKFMDDRLANPAYGVLLVTGLIMAFTTYSITLTWILIGLGLYAVMAVLGAVVYSRTLSRQIETLDAEGPSSAAFRALSARAAAVGIFLGVIAIAVVFDMVFKPQV